MVFSNTGIFIIYVKWNVNTDMTLLENVAINCYYSHLEAKTHTVESVVTNDQQLNYKSTCD